MHIDPYYADASGLVSKASYTPSIGAGGLAIHTNAPEGIAIHGIGESRRSDDLKLIGTGYRCSITIGIPYIAGSIFSEGGVADREGGRGGGDAQMAILGRVGADGVRGPDWGASRTDDEDIPDGAVSQPDGRRPRPR